MKIHPADLHFVGWPIRITYVNEALIESIKERGQITPIKVRKKGRKWEYDDGMCRVVACLILGIEVECEEIS